MPTRRGFTLVELLVVVSLIGIALAITIPALNIALSSGARASGVNTVSVGATMARALARREVGRVSTGSIDADYSGAALLFTPAGQIRLVENELVAIDSSGTPLEEGASDDHNGYGDVPDVDYIPFRGDTRVLGVTRRSATTGVDLELLPPPFAIRFDERGSLAVGEENADLVIYDADYDGNYDTSDDRPSGYAPEAWNPNRGANHANLQQVEGRWTLPFEQIESVIGVLVFSADDFRGAGFDLTEDKYDLNDGSAPGDAAAWILDNATPMLFSRATGNPIKQARPE